MHIGHVKLISIKAVTLSWEMLVLEDGISGKCQLQRDLQKESFLNMKLMVVSDVQTHRTSAGRKTSG